MAEEMVVIEKQINIDLTVQMQEVSIVIDAIEVTLLSSTALIAPGGGGGSAVWTPVGSGGSVLAANGSNYEVDTRLAAATINLPAAPPDGFSFAVRDSYATFATNYCNVVPAVGSGHRIIQTSVPEETLSLSYPHIGNGFFFRFRLADNTWSW